MKGIAFLSGIFGVLLSSSIMLPAIAQVTSDGTTNTTVNLNNNNFNILNGIQKGNNLFHSFKEFSIPTGGSATFQNSTDVVNIINRVTGGNISNIDGLIKASGNANLFLINPTGIVFGENARLDIGGSFLGTTAESILFEDGFEFSAVNAQSEPLLTVSVPLGLQMGNNPGEITVQGEGHRMTAEIFTPVNRNNNPVGLEVKQGNTLALIGGQVNFAGGIATVNGGGHLEIGSVSTGLVQLNRNNREWTGDYSSIQKFQDINLGQQSLVDASGTSGSIKLQGKNINLSEGSAAIIQNFGPQTSEGITVWATESVNLTGNVPDGKLGSLIRIDNFGTSQTDDISVNAARLSLQNAGQIWSMGLTKAQGSNITVDVTDSIEINGFAPNNPTIPSIILTLALNSGSAGNIKVSTDKLKLLDSGNIGSSTLSSGQAGKIQVDATSSIEIAGNNYITLAPSGISVSTIGLGNANTVLVNTSRLLLRDSGLIGSTTLATGSAGSVIVNASESVEVRGRAVGSIVPSRIASSAEILDETLQVIYGVPAIPSGNSGSITINTPSLHVANEASVNVRNDGPGKAGDLRINAESVFLDNRASITASTASGNGGNILLDQKNNLLLRQNSLISATSMGKGNGGNININSPVIVGLENSDIDANAVEGNGGNIDITTQGIFGLEFRDSLTEESDITASSQFGVNGTVEINNLSIDPSSGLVELPVALSNSSQQIAQGCSTNSGSSFVATGRGGIPQNPKESVDINPSWSDIRDLSAFRNSNNAQVTTISNKPAIVEATGFIRNEDGVIELVALENTPLKTKQVAQCSVGNT